MTGGAASERGAIETAYRTGLGALEAVTMADRHLRQQDAAVAALRAQLADARELLEFWIDDETPYSQEDFDANIERTHDFLARAKQEATPA